MKENMTAEENKTAVLDIYAMLAEKQYPGKGQAGRAILAAGWDSEATAFVAPGRLVSMGYTIDQNLAINCARGIAKRSPSTAKALASMK